MKLLRNILIGAAALTLPVMAAAPAGASTPHPKYVNWVHKYIPVTKHIPNKKIVAFGEKTCDYLRAGNSSWESRREHAGTQPTERLFV